MSTTEIQAAKKAELETQGQATARSWRRPQYDVSESGESFTVRVTLPGVNRSGVDISVEGDQLSIVGTRATKVPEDWHLLRRELPEGDYRLSLRLNVAINESKISAKVKDGVLNLTLPKADEVKPRKIKVN